MNLRHCDLRFAAQYRNIAISQNEIITVIKIAQKRELRNSAKRISQNSQNRISQKAQNRKRKRRIAKAQNRKSAQLIRAQKIFINHFCFLRYAICDQCTLYILFCSRCAILFQKQFYYNLS